MAFIILLQYSRGLWSVRPGMWPAGHPRYRACLRAPLAGRWGIDLTSPGDCWVIAGRNCGGAMRYRFDSFEIDPHRYELRRGGALCHVEPLVFDLLHFLA